MKVLVTGASGGLGQLIIEELLKRGHQVIASSKNEEKAKALPFYSKVKYIPYSIDTLSQSNLYTYFDCPDCLIHLAWEQLNEYRNEEHLSRQLPNHKHFLSNLIQNGLRDLTVVGTCYEYGLREGELEESMAAAPIFPYSQAKVALYEYLLSLTSKHSFSLKWPRVFYVFGEVKERKNLYTLLNAAVANHDESFNMSGGEQIRDFLSPTEIASYIVSVALQSAENGVVNICSGNAVRLKDLVENFLATHKSSLKINYGFYPYPNYEPMQTWGSTVKLKRILSKENKFEN